MLGQLALGIRQTGGQLDLKGWVRRAEVIAKMEEQVRARGAQISIKNSREDGSVKRYAWRFDALIQLAPPAGSTAAHGGRTTRERTSEPVHAHGQEVLP